MNVEEIYKVLIQAQEMGLIEINYKELAERIISAEDISYNSNGVPVVSAVAALVAERMQNPANALLHQHPQHEINAIQWAKKLVDEADFVVLDTETTGLDGYPLQVAVINDNGKTLFDKLIKPPPGVKVHPKAAAVHGITLDAVADAPEWRDVADEFREVVRDKPLVIYNADFDIGILKRANKFYNLRWSDDNVPVWTELHCAMEAYAEYNGDWNDYHLSYRWVKLTEAASVQGVEIEDAHSALGDCRMTLGVIQALAAKAQRGR